MAKAYAYPDLLNAAQGLLCDTVQLLAGEGIEFVVIGGWSPFFLNSGAVQHPGSRDVDLLFRDGGKPGELNAVIKKLRSAGYVYSAKHEFQLLRTLCVSDEEFVFNVDLLHASESHANPELFVDHISLPVRVSEFSAELVPARSIVVPVSAFIFSGHIVEHPTTAINPGGEKVQVTIPLMDELGTLVTKADSMLITKRTRDAFDVVLAIRQARDPRTLADNAAALRDDAPEIFAELTKLNMFRTQPRLRQNVEKYWGGDLPDDVWDEVLGGIYALTGEYSRARGVERNA